MGRNNEGTAGVSGGAPRAVGSVDHDWGIGGGFPKYLKVWLLFGHTEGRFECLPPPSYSFIKSVENTKAPPCQCQVVFCMERSVQPKN